MLTLARPRDTGGTEVTTFSFKESHSAKICSATVCSTRKKARWQFRLRDSGVNLGRFAAAVLLLGSIGWILEAMITAIIVQFIYRVRRELIVGTEVGG